MKWPGKIDKTVPSSGTPKNMDGMKSIIEWDIDIEIKNTPRYSGENEFKRKGEEAKINAPTVFTWRPGIIPVIAPQTTPNKHAIRRSKISTTNIILEIYQ